MYTSNALNPQSPFARYIFDLGVVAVWIMIVIFCAVTGMVIYSMFRYRWKEDEADPHQLAGNKTVEMIWTAIPFLIVILLFMLTARTMSKADPPAPGDPDLLVIGHQFWWEARYPHSGAIVANEIHIPAGKPISVELRSEDVLHEFWVPELARKMTNVPGKSNHIWIQADKVGTYLGVCTEFCGIQHAWMRFLIVAEDPAQFAQWEQAQLQVPPAPTTEAAIKGWKLFQRESCINCHSIAGTLGNTAHVGPDLTHIASRRQLGGGIIENTPANLRAWIQNPQTIKPGVLMPNYYFTPDELNQLEAYFETLK